MQEMISILGGVMLVASGLILVARASLLSGKTWAFPNGSKLIRIPMYIAAWAFCAYGSTLILGREIASLGSVGIFFVVLVYNMTYLVNLLSQRKHRNVISYSH